MKTGKKLLSVIISLALILGICIITSADEPQATLEGDLKVGSTLTVVTDIEYDRIDWYHYADATYPLIEGASGPTYTLKPEDLGHILYINIWVGEDVAKQLFTTEPVAAADSSQNDPTSAPDENTTTPGDSNSVLYLVALSLLSLLGLVVYKKKSSFNLN